MLKGLVDSVHGSKGVLGDPGGRGEVVRTHHRPHPETQLGERALLQSHVLENGIDFRLAQIPDHDRPIPLLDHVLGEVQILELSVSHAAVQSGQEILPDLLLHPGIHELIQGILLIG